jgi:Flp pilus assembly protein TadG
MTDQVSRRIRQNERGSTLVLVTVFMVAIFGFAALSIDVSHVFQEQRRAQIGADAASFAAVALLTNSSVLKSAVISEAGSIATANGIMAEEIAASQIGQIQVGKWNTTSLIFTPDATPYNAVRVPAKRGVPLMFAKVVGTGQMTPAVKSVSMLDGAGSAFGGGGAGMIPFAIHLKQGTNAFNVPYSFDKHDIGSGNFGKMALVNPQDPNQGWNDQMTAGCNCTVTNGSFIGDIPGNAHIDDGFRDRLNSNPYVVFPIFDDQGPGNSGHGDQIIGFVAAKILSVSGNGNWTVTVQNVPMLIAGGPGGPTNKPFAQARILVQ